MPKIYKKVLKKQQINYKKENLRTTALWDDTMLFDRWTSILEQYDASIFRALLVVTPKHRHLHIKLHGIMLQTTVIFTFKAITASNHNKLVPVHLQLQTCHKAYLVCP
jgi:hypothetical protein